jgi:hypothetical protein
VPIVGFSFTCFSRSAGGSLSSFSISQIVRRPKHRGETSAFDVSQRGKARGFQLRWQSIPAGPQGKAKKASKTKFTCPDCAQNAWAKPDALLICGACYEDGDGDIRLMLAEPNEDAEAA